MRPASLGSLDRLSSACEVATIPDPLAASSARPDLLERRAGMRRATPREMPQAERIRIFGATEARRSLPALEARAARGEDVGAELAAVLRRVDGLREPDEATALAERALASLKELAPSTDLRGVAREIVRTTDEMPAAVRWPAGSFAARYLAAAEKIDGAAASHSAG